MALPHIRFFSSDFNAYKDRNLYEILNVDKNASQNEIKQAYYEFAKKYHPDSNHNNNNNNNHHHSHT